MATNPQLDREADEFFDTLGSKLVEMEKTKKAMQEAQQGTITIEDSPPRKIAPVDAPLDGGSSDDEAEVERRYHRAGQLVVKLQQLAEKKEFMLSGKN